MRLALYRFLAEKGNFGHKGRPGQVGGSGPGGPPQVKFKVQVKFKAPHDMPHDQMFIRHIKEEGGWSDVGEKLHKKEGGGIEHIPTYEKKPNVVSKITYAKKKAQLFSKTKAEQLAAMLKKQGHKVKIVPETIEQKAPEEVKPVVPGTGKGPNVYVGKTKVKPKKMGPYKVIPPEDIQKTTTVLVKDATTGKKKQVAHTILTPKQAAGVPAPKGILPAQEPYEPELKRHRDFGNFHLSARTDNEDGTVGLIYDTPEKGQAEKEGMGTTVSVRKEPVGGKAGKKGSILKIAEIERGQYAHKASVTGYIPFGMKEGQQFLKQRYGITLPKKKGKSDLVSKTIYEKISMKSAMGAHYDPAQILKLTHDEYMHLVERMYNEYGVPFKIMDVQPVGNFKQCKCLLSDGGKTSVMV